MDEPVILGIANADTVVEARYVRPTSLLEYLSLNAAITAGPVDENVYDLIFARVQVADGIGSAAEAVDKMMFIQKTQNYRTSAILPMSNPLELVKGRAVPYTYVEVASWLVGSQLDAFRYMALAVHLDLCRLITPYDVNPDVDAVTAQLLARMGMLAIVVITPE